MNKSLIKKHNFEVAKRKIEQFSNNLPSYPFFTRVEVDGGLFGWGDHSVTGQEMNNFIDKVQDKFISINSSLSSIISEFREIYNAFNFLDGEYINGIISAIEGAEEASNQALKAQYDIKVTVDNLKKTVEKLVILKNTVDRIDKAVSAKLLSFDEITTNLDKSYKVKQIPSIVNNVSTLQSKVTSLNSNLSSLSTEFNKHKYNFEKTLDSFIKNAHQINERINKDIKGLQQYRASLESYKHLKDVDAIWGDVEKHKSALAGVNKQVDTFIENVNKTTERVNKDITVLQQYRTSLESYKHLRDVDTIWDTVEKHNTNLTGLHKQVDDFISEVRVTEKEIKESIQRIDSKISAQSIYEKKIKIVYWIAGGAIALTVTNVVLQLLGIL